MTEFKYAPMFQLGQDKTEYYKIPGSEKLVSTSEFEGHKILKVSKEALTLMSNTAFRDVSFLLRRSHNEQVAKILSDPEASDNDKYVALTLSEASAMRKLPARGSFRSVRIPVPPSYTERKVSRYGPASAMKRPSAWEFSRPTPKRICVIRRTLLWICTTKSTPSATCLPR